MCSLVITKHSEVFSALVSHLHRSNSNFMQHKGCHFLNWLLKCLSGLSIVKLGTFSSRGLKELDLKPFL